MSDALHPLSAQPLRRFKRYPAYKDSGVEWLGEIPAHWKVRRLKYLAQVNPEALLEETDPRLEISYIDIGGVDSLGRILEKENLTFASAPTRARRVVRDGDVIVSTVRTYLRAIAPIKNPEPGMVVSTGFAVIRPGHELTTDYAAYAFRAPYFVERVVANSTGVSFPAISESKMATHELAVPPEAEQRAIAVFLDRETARIDALVAKKERLIQLLQEKRTALVTRAVTKGLDPTVPMKDSGVEWLGEIPAHWEVVPSTWLFAERKERAREGDEHLSATQKYGVIPRAEFERLEGRQVVHAFMHLEQRKHVEVNDFVISMRSFEGGLEIVRAPGCVRSSYCVLRGSEEVHPSFFAYLFKSSTYIQALRSTSNFIRDGQDLSFANFRQIRLPRVPLQEQRAIATFLDQEIKGIDALVSKISEAIDRLKELRTALISAAVTGKIDVREGAA